MNCFYFQSFSISFWSVQCEKKAKMDFIYIHIKIKKGRKTTQLLRLNELINNFSVELKLLM